MCFICFECLCVFCVFECVLIRLSTFMCERCILSAFWVYLSAFFECK